MQKQSFKIEFYAVENPDEAGCNSRLIKYAAVITVVSKNFQLFKVSGIKKITGDYVIHLSDSYFLTSYPSAVNGQLKWKDASTFQPNNFLQMIGEAIESVEESVYAE